MARHAPWALSLAIVLVLAAAPAVGQDAADEDAETRLFAHWPDDVRPGSGEPVPMTLASPTGESDIDAGPLAPRPGGGALPAFTYVYETQNGNAGVPSAFELEANDTATLFVFLSSGETVNGSADAGPNVTVEAQLLVGPDVVGIGEASTTLVAATSVNETVQRVEVPIGLNATEAEAGDELRVDFWIFQGDGNGGVQDHNGWTFHTGEDFPTGVTVPIAQEPLTGSDGEAGLEDGDATPGPSAMVGLIVTALVAVALARGRLRPGS